MLLSVIIPYYHVENYIGDCLARAARLPADQCEILLVDDCGSDSSASIASAYCASHANMRIVHRQENGGLSAARNTGLAQAAGEYVYFLDSDDIPEPDALWALACRAKESELDVGKARFVYFDDETGKETPGPALEETDVTEGGALFASQCARGLYEPMVWQCVYRRAFLAEKGLIMADGLLFEDELFQAPALVHAARAAVYDLCILRYRQRAGSIMGSFAKSSRWCASYLEVCRRLSALADTLPAGAPKKALRRRVGQIALSVAKNISGYQLPQDVAQEVIAFVRVHQSELCGYALCSQNALIAAQGLLLQLSLRLFLALYRLS